jgi:hypothetical protein
VHLSRLLADTFRYWEANQHSVSISIVKMLGPKLEHRVQIEALIIQGVRQFLPGRRSYVGRPYSQPQDAYPKRDAAL